MKWIKTYESFENWGFKEWVIDALTFILDDYGHTTTNHSICIHSDSDDVLDEINKALEFLKKKFNFFVKMVGYTGYGYIIIMEVKQEYIDFVNDIMDRTKTKVDEDEYPNQIFYFIDDVLYLQQMLESRKFFVNYRDFTYIFSKMFLIEDNDELFYLLRHLICSYLNIDMYEIGTLPKQNKDRFEKHFFPQLNISEW